MIINQILVKRGVSTPPPVPTTGLRVQWLDYDGTILKTEYVAAGGNATPPANPLHANLTFQGWNISHLNVQTDLDIGATYITTDGKTHVHIRLTTFTGLSTTLALNKSDDSTLTVDWGDGSAVSTFTNTGEFATPTRHYTGTGAGDYVIKMWISSGEGSYGFGTLEFTRPLVGGSTNKLRNTLRKVHTGEKVTSISINAFQNTQNLTSITIPSTVTSIEASAFRSCECLSSITIPSTVTTIGISAFHGCYNLISASIPSGVTSIEASAFNVCYNLISITIPSTVTSIGISAFHGCSGLTSMNIPSGVTAIGASAFRNLYSITGITIPSGVTSIESSVFNGCSGLTSMTIPSGVTTIGTYAFDGCISIMEYTCLSTTPPTLAATNAFAGINSICKIYVPDASVAAYKAATNWSTYANYIYALSTRGAV